ncbi:MAG: leucyl aminopeptidase [Bryobacteraceae bacterium]|nr:leucyl aminopeptidase [Bryobacteraceae bacterium]
MQTRIDTRPLEQIDADALVIPVFERPAPEGLAAAGEALAPASARAANEKAGGWIEECLRTGEFSAKALESVTLHRPSGVRARRLVALGLGKPDKCTNADLRKAAGAALRLLKPKGVRSIALLLDPELAAPDLVSAAVEGAFLADFEPDAYKTDPKKNEKAVDEFIVVLAEPSTKADEALRRGQILAESQNFTRALVNEPGNRLTPLVLADRARAMAEETGLSCEVLDREQMKQLGMGSLLGVAQGSANPPALIVLSYKPPRALSNDHLALVGKGVTFDTGGISIKPSEGMEKMKYDMAGGAAVLGAMRAIAQLKPSISVTAFVPAVENMPGSAAQRPGDIVTSMNGKTIEVLNTDAEGRLILIDAITYAIRQGCTHLVDAATLTGAIVVALGNVHVGAFTNDEDFRAKVIAAAKAEGEKMWAMPLDDEYKEQLKSAFADLANIGGRWGGAVTAAKFIEEFVEEKPWVHLDIAGTAWVEEAKPFLSKGPSGVAVRTFVNLALNW